MVEEYLTDRDQEEALRNWWRENWSWILGGIVLGLALLGGWQYWKIHTANRSAEAAKLYDDFHGALDRKDLEGASRSLSTLAADHKKSPYTQQGRLLLAKNYVEASKYDEALPLLRAVASLLDRQLEPRGLHTLLRLLDLHPEWRAAIEHVIQLRPPASAVLG